MKRRLQSISATLIGGGLVGLLLAVLLIFLASPGAQVTTPEPSLLSRTPGQHDTGNPAPTGKPANLEGNPEGDLPPTAASGGLPPQAVEVSSWNERYEKTGPVVEMDDPKLFLDTPVFSSADEGITEADWAAIPPVPEVSNADTTEVWDADE